ncbi:ComEA family DNA-binding protein [Candidatus Latescibacterota bacterium]
MGLFTKRDRIAIALISALILIGWGLKFVKSRSFESDTVTVIRNAAELIQPFDSADTVNVLLSDAYSPVNINTANFEKIQTLPMIGPVKATAIIEFREKHGSFTDKNDIMNVTGIGPATYEKIENRITIHSKPGSVER